MFEKIFGDLSTFASRPNNFKWVLCSWFCVCCEGVSPKQ